MHEEYVKEVHNIIQYIEDNIMNEHLSDNIVKELKYSPFHFHRIFQRIVGMSVSTYIKKRKMTYAASDLMREEERILDIALKYCFSSQEAFTRVFQKMYGMSPGKYRKYARKLMMKREEKRMDYNLPKGWMPAGTHLQYYDMGVDYKQVHEGKASGYITGEEGSNVGFATMGQTFKANKYRGERVRFSGFLKTENVNNGAMLWMRVDGENGETLNFDNMENRSVKGTTNWNQYEVVLDVPESSIGIAFGMMLAGEGKAWVDSLAFEVVDKTVPVTAASIGEYIPEEPVNLTFEL
ncbi:helix-turn-helix transcriptional regulator [Priestia endophytica]|uniref:helix-turn-helix transcriptional regulator n=1 Tax=Priestia endophytica TaxID=135735 RepID=UPI00124CFE70|nr:AraC family transcriptional regulator [Priestia endophytica]KAB2492406.1 helix-turn-helix transcriptional regulator [Priestia endophytica]